MSLTIYWKLCELSFLTDKIDWKTCVIDATYLYQKKYLMCNFAYYPGFSKITHYKINNTLSNDLIPSKKDLTNHFNHYLNSSANARYLNISPSTKTDILESYNYFIAPIYTSIYYKNNRGQTDKIETIEKSECNGCNGYNENLERYIIVGIFILGKEIINNLWERITKQGILRYNLMLYIGDITNMDIITLYKKKRNENITNAINKCKQNNIILDDKFIQKIMPTHISNNLDNNMNILFSLFINNNDSFCQQFLNKIKDIDINFNLNINIEGGNNNNNNGNLNIEKQTITITLKLLYILNNIKNYMPLLKCIEGENIVKLNKETGTAYFKKYNKMNITTIE